MRGEAGPRETPPSVQDQSWWVCQEVDLDLRESGKKPGQEILPHGLLPAHSLAQVQHHASPWWWQGEHEAGLQASYRANSRQRLAPACPQVESFSSIHSADKHLLDSYCILWCKSMTKSSDLHSLVGETRQRHRQLQSSEMDRA